MDADSYSSPSIAIIGAGPAGCSLACLLAMRGIECLVFDDEKKPELLVGESLVPAAMPILRRLGVEAEVAAISSLKKGAALRHGSGSPRVDFAFQELGKGIPDYAYNIPRPAFDAVLRKRAQTLGVRFIAHRAKVVANPEDEEREISLSEESLSAAGLSTATQPDLLIDASGRSRLFSRALQVPAIRGPRNDVAHFAHFENHPIDSALDGQIIISVLKCGWSWQIPLPGKTSVGVVLDSEAAASYGNTAAQRLEAIMRQNAVLNKSGSRRVTDVKTYANYQLIAERESGKGWVLLGDALGFVDPMLSPGVFMALESARLLDDLVFRHKNLAEPQRNVALQKYYQEIQDWHRCWSRTIEYFYDGRLLCLGEIRPDVEENQGRFSIGILIDRIVSKQLSRLVSGAGTRSKTSQTAISLICKLLVNNPEKLASYAINAVASPDSRTDVERQSAGAKSAEGVAA